MSCPMLSNSIPQKGFRHGESVGRVRDRSTKSVEMEVMSGSKDSGVQFWNANTGHAQMMLLLRPVAVAYQLHPPLSDGVSVFEALPPCQ